jgi:hypothetical protein
MHHLDSLGYAGSRHRLPTKWIADLMACGLLKASFVPEADVHDLRAR